MTIIKTIFKKESFSLKKKALNKMVVTGAAKNKRLEIMGLVSFIPKKLQRIAKNTTTLIKKTRIFILGTVHKNKLKSLLKRQSL